MGTELHRPQAQHHRQQLKARRLRAAELFAAGLRQSEVARQLGVTRQAVNLWHGRWKLGGSQALRSREPTGLAPRLSDTQLATVEPALNRGAVANGFTGEVWTCDRVAIVIEHLTGVRHHTAHVWAILSYRLGWSVQRPRRLAAERDQAAIDAWVAADWPRIKKTPNDADPVSSSSTSPASA